MKFGKLLGLAAVASVALVGNVMAEDIKLSDEEMKKAANIYFDRCAGCHGMERKGALGPKLTPERSKELGTATLEHILWEGTPGGMPDWGKSGEMSKEDTALMAKYIQITPPPAPEKSIGDMKKSWETIVPVKDRPTKPETTRNWKNYMGVVLRDVGKVAIIDGDTKEVVAIEKSGFAVHILRTSASGRYMYTIGRDGRATIIDLWMKTPKTVSKIQVCNDARSIDTSKYKGKEGDFMDKLAVVGCYWPPAIVTLDGETLEPMKLVSTAAYNVSTTKDDKGAMEDTQFVREARVAAIVASHYKPEWVINIKEAGQVWLYNYANPMNPAIKMLEAERYLHDGGWDLSKQYFLVAANARDKVVAVDTKNGKIAAIIPTKNNKPHPGRGVNVDHPTLGPLWGTGHIGTNVISFIGTDPVKHKDNAWKVVKEIQLPGVGGGNLFVKSHPKCDYIFADRPVNPDGSLQQIFVIDKKTFEIKKSLEIPAKFTGKVKLSDGSEKTIRGPVHLEFNHDGSEIWTSIWGFKDIPTPVLVYDAKTLKLKATIEHDEFRTPTGKFNVYNTMKDIY